MAICHVQWVLTGFINVKVIAKVTSGANEGTEFENGTSDDEDIGNSDM